MVIPMLPHRVVYCEEIHRYVLNIGPYHLWFDTEQEAYDYWEQYKEELGLNKEV